MSQPLQPQLLKLEDALEEARRAGTTIPDQLQQAILLKCVGGQLRTHLNLAIQETTSFKDLREHVLLWDRSQQKWSGLIFSEIQLQLQWRWTVFMLGKRVEKTKARALLRKAHQKENQKESRSPSRMENQTTKVNRRAMEKANQVGSRMTIRATKEKVVSSQIRLAIVVESSGILPVIVSLQL